LRPRNTRLGQFDFIAIVNRFQLRNNIARNDLIPFIDDDFCETAGNFEAQIYLPDINISEDFNMALLFMGVLELRPADDRRGQQDRTDANWAIAFNMIGHASPHCLVIRAAQGFPLKIGLSTKQTGLGTKRFS